MSTLLQTIKILLDMFSGIDCAYIKDKLYLQYENKTYRVELVEIVGKSIKDIQEEAEDEK